MSKPYKHEDGEPLSVNEGDGAMRFYSSQEEQELVRLKESMSRTATEKFYRLMGLMKTQLMLRQAKIHHKS
jgi:hypothetical protein